MQDKSIIEGWKLLAEQGHDFHAETVLLPIEYIEELDDISTSLVHDIEFYEARDIRKEEERLRYGFDDLV